MWASDGCIMTYSLTSHHVCECMRLQGKLKPLRDSPLDYKNKMQSITFPVNASKYFCIMFSVEGRLLQSYPLEHSDYVCCTD